jgi:hypothetical protein
LQVNRTSGIIIVYHVSDEATSTVFVTAAYVLIFIVQSDCKVTHTIRDIIVILCKIWNFDSSERLNCDLSISTLHSGGSKCLGGT